MEKLTEKELNELMTLAGNATPGPWERGSREPTTDFSDYSVCTQDGRVDVVIGDLDVRISELQAINNAAYIAAANPATLRRLLLELQHHRAATPAAGAAAGAWVAAGKGPQRHEEDYTLHVLKANGKVGSGNYLRGSEAEYCDDDPTPGWFYWGEDVYERYHPQPTHYHPLPAAPTTPTTPGIVALAPASHGGNTRNVLNADTCHNAGASCDGCGVCAGPATPTTPYN